MNSIHTNMNIEILNLIVGVAGLVLAFLFYKSQIETKLDKILELEKALSKEQAERLFQIYVPVRPLTKVEAEGLLALYIRSRPLAKDQAKCLIDMYLKVVMKEMLTDVHEYITSGSFSKSIKDNNPHSAINKVSNIARTAITNERAKLDLFVISGGLTFREFVDLHSPLDGENIKKATEEVEKKFISTFQQGDSSTEALRVLYDQVESIIKKSNKLADDNLKIEIEKAYKPYEGIKR